MMRFKLQIPAAAMLKALLVSLLALFVAAASASAQEEPTGLEDALPTEQLSQVKIVGFGDSLMAGYLLPSNAAFPQQLEKALNDKGYEVTVENAGVSGDTTTGGLSRIDWSIPDGTNLVILELGANDALRGIQPDITEKNLDEMLAKLKARGISVIPLQAWLPLPIWEKTMQANSTRSIPGWRANMMCRSTRSSSTV
ncbi:hypothetical protein C032_00014 [Brucella abortus 63/294]|nr:hypothetical protein C032_00014 [Brucella abortus 63/294]ENS12451.1 hypothetical protein C980_00052 [Brucella abortus 88/217]ERT99982.1 hypothetical protein P039_03106 [Brucella abortus 07-0994-2411]